MSLLIPKKKEHFVDGQKVGAGQVVNVFKIRVH